MDDETHEISISFNKTKAKIAFGGQMSGSEFAHGIALLIVALDNKIEDSDLKNTINGVIDAIENIKG